MSPRLQDKVCIVTGAGAPGDGIGNGRAVAILFAREGGRVLVVDRDADAAARTVEMIGEEGGEAASFVGDLTDERTAARMVQDAVDRWGRLDVLHNNIGITSRGSVVETSREDWDRVLEVNVTSIMLASKYAIPVMESGGGGSVINISSISAIRPRGLTSYTASKGAVIALTRAMAVDHGPARIRVNCIAPGPLYTPHAALQGMSEEDRDRRRRASLLQVEGTAWDVAHAAVYLASDESRYVSAVLLPVDGGASMGSPAR
jgi:NAD(P)-dependent dehydrogenase (short-subunit alcohol dehydrogenase family)